MARRLPQLPLPPATMYLASSFVWGLLFWMMATVSMIYQVEVVGLDALELVLIGTVLEVTAFVFEVPTGLVADTISRRLSVLVGFALTGIAWTTMAVVPSFTFLALGSFLWGVGWTLVSGAHEAWLADEVGVEEAGRLYLRGQKLSSNGSFIGIFTAMVLGSWHESYPILLAGLLYMAWAGYCVLAMQETNFSPARGEATHQLGKMGEAFTSGLSIVRGSTTLVLLMVVGVVLGTFSEGYDRLANAHLLRSFEFPSPYGFEPVVLFGVFTAVGSILSIWLTSNMEKWVDTTNSRHIATALTLLTGLIIAAVLTFALVGEVWIAIVMLIVLFPLRRVMSPLTTAWLNQHTSSSVRATVLSMHSQSDALGQMGGGPVVGLIGREFGLRIAITVSAILLLPALWLYQRRDIHTVEES